MSYQASQRYRCVNFQAARIRLAIAARVNRPTISFIAQRIVPSPRRCVRKIYAHALAEG